MVDQAIRKSGDEMRQVTGNAGARAITVFRMKGGEDFLVFGRRRSRNIGKRDEKELISSKP